MGYQINVWLLNAQQYGVPQTRKRVFIVGTKSKNSKYSNISEPKEVKSKKYRSTFHLLEKNVDEKYYLSELIKKTIFSPGTGKFYYKPEHNKLIARPLTHTMHKMHRASQDNYYSDSFINGSFDNKTNTVKETLKGKNRIRRITPKEALRLQGFSEHDTKKAITSGVSDTRLYMLAGNSVPAPMVTSVGKSLLFEYFKE